MLLSAHILLRGRGSQRGIARRAIHVSRKVRTIGCRSLIFVLERSCLRQHFDRPHQGAQNPQDRTVAVVRYEDMRPDVAANAGGHAKKHRLRRPPSDRVRNSDPAYLGLLAGDNANRELRLRTEPCEASTQDRCRDLLLAASPRCEYRNRRCQASSSEGTGAASSPVSSPGSSTGGSPPICSSLWRANHSSLCA